MSRLLGIVLVLLAFLVQVEASRISRRALDSSSEASALQASLPHPPQAVNSDVVVAQDASERSATNSAAKARVRQMVDDAGSLLLGMINWEGKAASAVPKVMKALPKVCKPAEIGLGTVRKNVKQYLQNVGNVPRDQLVEDLESAGFKKVFDGNGMQHFERGNWKLRLDPPQGPTTYPHIHINRGGNRNAFDVNLKPVSHRSPVAHIPIQPQ